MREGHRREGFYNLFNRQDPAGAFVDYAGIQTGMAPGKGDGEETCVGSRMAMGCAPVGGSSYFTIYASCRKGTDLSLTQPLNIRVSLLDNQGHPNSTNQRPVFPGWGISFVLSLRIREYHCRDLSR